MQSVDWVTLNTLQTQEPGTVDRVVTMEGIFGGGEGEWSQDHKEVEELPTVMQCTSILVRHLQLYDTEYSQDIKGIVVSCQHLQAITVLEGLLHSLYTSCLINQGRF